MGKLFSIFLVCVILCRNVQSQELFTYTEPASNMAAKSIGLRLTTTVMRNEIKGVNNVHINPELMMALNKKWMFHLDGFISNRNGSPVAEGGSLYSKFRFHSVDEVHSHFRLAAYGLLSVNNSDIHQSAIDLRGYNSGVEAGLVATQLKGKTAVSASAAILHAFDNASGNKFVLSPQYRNAIGYTFSVGKLLLPKEYVSYKQTNLNGMVEVLGQYNPAFGKSYLDIAPVVQFIFLSKMRLDLSYRFCAVKDLTRTAPNGGLIRFEYNFFNVFK